MSGKFVYWDDLCQTVRSGEDGEGWPTWEAADAANDYGWPAYHGLRGLIFGRAKAMAAQAADAAQDRADAVDRVRRAAVVASIAAQPVVVAPKPDRATTLAKLLASNEAALAACKRTERAEIARLRENCARLRAEIGIKTPEEKLLTAIFGEPA